jgi:predicted transcriptional regulator
MEVKFTPEQEAHLAKIATQKGVAPAELVRDAALRLLEDDARFRAGARKGVEQADRGESIEEDEMDSRVKRMFRP